jgi:3-oxoacyl-[acyl-carrier-protein] synthase-1
MIYRIADNIISPLGETTLENYQAVKAGASKLHRYDHYRHIPEPFTASLLSSEQNERLKTEGLTRFEALAYTSISKALRQTTIDPKATNVVLILSTTKGNISLLANHPADRSRIYPGTSARKIALKLGMTTMPVTVCNACISGVSAIILALRLLEAGCYDYAICCGADTQPPFTISGFQSLKAVSDAPCRPFDLERTGLNLGEAAATIVLERKVEGGGLKLEGDVWRVEAGAIRNDAFHISSPSKNGEGARLALKAVTEGAGELAFINAHGTATMFNDQMESVAIVRAGLGSTPVNAYKGYFGHTLGTAGLLETILSMAAADDHTILATKGFEERGVSGNIRLSAAHATTEKTRFVKMISGFGGCNAAILVARHEAAPQAAPREESAAPRLRKTHTIRISPTTLTIDGEEKACEGEGKARLTDIYKRYIADYPKFYKMDALGRLGFVASELLLQAENDRKETPRHDRAVILFNRSSSILADEAYQASIEDSENYYPSPAAFVYTLPNIVTGEIAIRNHYQGETSFYILPERDDALIQQIAFASFGDPATKSILGGWLDYADDEHYEADLYIEEKTSKEK